MGFSYGYWGLCCDFCGAQRNNRKYVKKKLIVLMDFVKLGHVVIFAELKNCICKVHAQTRKKHTKNCAKYA